VTAEIVLQIFRFGFLLLLWLFIFAAFRVVRADLFGGRAGRVSSVPPRAAKPGGKKARGGPKTLVVTAIELLVGGRADPSVVRPGAEEARRCRVTTTDRARRP